MNKKVIGTLLVLCGLMIGVVQAGTGYHLTCENKACRYEEKAVLFGEGMFHERLTGYCLDCAKFVYITWKKEGKGPERLARVWDAETGRTLWLYACPHCQKPFLPIPDATVMKYCPKCAKPTLKREAVLAVD